MKRKPRCFARWGNGRREKKRKWERKTKTSLKISEQNGWQTEGKQKRLQSQKPVTLLRSEDTETRSRKISLNSSGKLRNIEQKALTCGSPEQWLVRFQCLLFTNFFHFLPTLAVCFLLCIRFLSKLSFGKFNFSHPPVTLNTRDEYLM